MKLRLSSHGFRAELALAASLSVVLGVVVPPTVVERVDDLVVTFVSILVAAAIPGIALTVSAQRPAVSSPLEAKKLGEKLLGQARFWFSFIWTGGLAVAALILGGALQWSLPAPARPEFLSWAPSSGAWLVVLALFFLLLFMIRTRHLVGAVESLIELGTKAHAEATAAAELQLQAEVARQLAGLPVPPDRGSAVSERPRH